MNLLDRVASHFRQSIETKRRALDVIGPVIVAAAERFARCLSQGGKIMACGNGGSASDAQHFSAEMLGRFEMERAGRSVVALTTDTSTLTAVANDYGFEAVFARQVQALGCRGDTLLAISTSGNSSNVVAAVQTAQELDMNIVVLSGRDGGRVVGVLQQGDIEIRVPCFSTARIQEMHILIIHCICDLVDQILFGEKA